MFVFWSYFKYPIYGNFSFFFIIPLVWMIAGNINKCIFSTFHRLHFGRLHLSRTSDNQVWALNNTLSSLIYFLRYNYFFKFYLSFT